MRSSVVTSGCVSLCVMVALSGAPSARADNASFVREAKALGFVQAADNLISTARSACYFLSRNRSPGEVEERILRYTMIDPPNLAHQFFVMAVNEYCPQYAALVSP